MALLIDTYLLVFCADGREVEAKRAVPREENNPVAHSKTKKVFLGGLSADTLEEEIKEVLEQHGKVCEQSRGQYAIISLITAKHVSQYPITSSSSVR